MSAKYREHAWGLAALCSLQIADFKISAWWPGTGLNRRRRPFQGRALPLSYLASVQTFSCISCAESGAAGDGWAAPRTVCCNDLGSIPTHITHAKPRRTAPTETRITYLLATLSLTEL